MGKFGSHFGKNYQRTTFTPGAGIKGQKGEIYVLGLNKRGGGKRKATIVTYVSAPLIARTETKLATGLKSHVETKISSPLRLKQAVVTYVSSGLKSITNTYVKSRVMGKDGRPLLSKQERRRAIAEIYIRYMLRKVLRGRK